MTGSAAPQVKAPPPPSAQADRKPAAVEGPTKSVPELRHLKYRSLGPARGGRVDRVIGVAGDPRTYYAATASSGVWKSVDGGVTWKPIFDDQTVATAGSIAVAPSDPNVLYVGTGEANIRGDVQEGDGIYKSTDAGKTWTHVWTERGQIGTHDRPSRQSRHRIRGRARPGRSGPIPSAACIARRTAVIPGSRC